MRRQQLQLELGRRRRLRIGGEESATTKNAKSETGGEAEAGGPGVVAVAKSSELGTASSSTPRGFTVYDFHKDKGTTSACYGACAKASGPR